MAWSEQVHGAPAALLPGMFPRSVDDIGEIVAAQLVAGDVDLRSVKGIAGATAPAVSLVLQRLLAVKGRQAPLARNGSHAPRLTSIAAARAAPR